MLRTTFSQRDDIIFEFADGSEAVEHFPECLPDITLMDIVMHMMDGITATKLLIQRFPASRIIIVSQYDDPALRQKALDAGARGYFLKDRLDDLQTFLNSERISL